MTMGSRGPSCPAPSVGDFFLPSARPQLLGYSNRKRIQTEAKSAQETAGRKGRKGAGVLWPGLSHSSGAHTGYERAWVLLPDSSFLTCTLRGSSDSPSGSLCHPDIHIVLSSRLWPGPVPVGVGIWKIGDGRYLSPGFQRNKK